MGGSPSIRAPGTVPSPCPCRRPSVVTEGYRGSPPLPPTHPSSPRRHPVPTSVVSVTAMGESISTANIGEHRVNIGASEANIGSTSGNIGQT